MTIIGDDREDFLELDVDEVGLRILETLRSWAVQGKTPSANTLFRETEQHEMAADGPGERERLLGHLAAGWQWLRNEGFLAPHPLHSGDWEYLTHAAERVDIAAYLVEGRATDLLRRAQLDPQLADEVLPLFRRGKYGVAVLAAMRLVEVQVRVAGELPAELVGVDLMRQAFRIGGPLDDPRLPRAEREGRSALFAGAIAVYKNPQSHRIVNIDDPQEAAELVLLANALLRILARVSGTMLTAQEVADMLHVGIRTVRRMADRDDLPAFIVSDEQRFRLDDVMALVARHQRTTR